MDDPKIQERLAARPQALCWVGGTDDLDAVVTTSPVDLGEIVLFTRGERSWRLRVPKDGHLPMGGLLPAFISWSPGPHPSTGQQDLGVRLDKVQLSHPNPDALGEIFKELKVDHLAEVSAGELGLSFVLDTLQGIVIVD